MSRRRPYRHVHVHTLSAAFLLCGGMSAVVAPRGASSEEPAYVHSPREEARIELGRRLFFDPAVSRSGVRACASCHDPEHGYSDPERSSEDDILVTRRHSQTLIDFYRSRNAHWDGEFDGVEELVDARLGLVDGVPYGGTAKDVPSVVRELILRRPRVFGPDGTGLTHDGELTEDARAFVGLDGRTPDALAPTAARPDAHRERHAARVLPFDATRLPEAADVVDAAGRYREAMLAVYETDRVTTARLSELLAAYVKSLRSTPAPLDRWLDGDATALSPAAQRGLELFRGRAGCAQCHLLDGDELLEGRRPPLTDLEFHNTGVEWRSQASKADDSKGMRVGDPGRALISTSPKDRRAFKTPTLRHVAQRGPFMHDGSLATLRDVVMHYAAGGADDPLQDPRLRPFEVGPQDVADLVAFLQALTGDEIPGRARRAWGVRAGGTRIRLVDARGRPLAGLPVDLVPEGDHLPGDAETRMVRATTDERGFLAFAPSLRTHTRVVLPRGLVPLGGPLVPDTCRDALLRVPVDGSVRLVLRAERDAGLPPELVAEHEGTMRIPGHPVPRTPLRRLHEMRLPGGVVAVYEAWVRTDVPADVILRLPGEREILPGRRLVLRPGKTLEVDLRR